MTTTPTSRGQARHQADRECAACEEGERFLSMSRRRFFTLAGASGLITATTLSGARVGLLDPAARAFTGTNTDALVVLSLRGGMDGLSVVVPAADPDLPGYRPDIAVPASALKQVDQTFGLHPALAPLFPLWDSGKVAAVQAVGMERPNRSHFDAMEEMERAAPGSAMRTGWIDRTIGVVGAPDDQPFAATAIGTDHAPTSLDGPNPEFIVGNLDGVTLGVDQGLAPLSGWRNAVTALHDGGRPLGTATTLKAFSAVEAVAGVAPGGEGYPGGGLAASLRDVARLIKDPTVLLKVATVDLGGWDMHQNLGKADNGWMYDKLTEMSSALAAFAADLGPAIDNVTVVTLSEFGRRVQQNGDGGVDHGYGNSVLVMGGGVRGGKVYGNWPGLAPEALVDGDLAATTDYRSIIAEILSARCGVADISSVFPGVPADRLGLVNPR